MRINQAAGDATMASLVIKPPADEVRVGLVRVFGEPDAPRLGSEREPRITPLPLAKRRAPRVEMPPDR